MTHWPFGELKRNHYGVIYADPPWRYEVWSGETAVKRRASGGTNKAAAAHYETMGFDDLKALPVGDLAAADCVLLCWVTWPCLKKAFDVIEAWGFEYKTCGFDWMKASVNQIDMFRDDADGQMGLGHWTRSNTEPCLLATRGKPKRVSAGVRMGIIEPRREHSRKPDCTRGRIEQLVQGPYLELFARQPHRDWDAWGNQTEKFKAAE